MKHRIGRACWVVSIGLWALMLNAPQAYATAELRITDGTNYVDIVDNNASVACVGLFNPADCQDRNSLAGQIDFTGTLGAWRIDNVVGINLLTLGSGPDLLEIAATIVHQVLDGSSLTILFSDDGFTSGSFVWSAGAVSTPGSVAAFSAFEDSAEFGGCSGLPAPGGCNGQIGSTITSGITTGSGAGGALTLEADLSVPVDHGFVSLGGTLSSVNVPEPATLALLGIGIAGIGFARRRKLN